MQWQNMTFRQKLSVFGLVAIIIGGAVESMLLLVFAAFVMGFNITAGHNDSVEIKICGER